LAGKNLNGKWPLDYWGLANHKALEYILENDNRESIAVRRIHGSPPLEITFKILDHEKRKRLYYSRGRANTDYLISNFGRERDNDALEKELAKDFTEYHTIYYEDEPILRIYKSKNQHTLNTKPLQNFSSELALLSVQKKGRKGYAKITLELTNKGDEVWHSAHRGAYGLAIAIFSIENKKSTIQNRYKEKKLFPLPKDMQPGEKVTMQIHTRGLLAENMKPDGTKLIHTGGLAKGGNIITISMIQTGVAWFHDKNKDSEPLKVRLQMDEDNDFVKIMHPSALRKIDTKK